MSAPTATNAPVQTLFDAIDSAVFRARGHIAAALMMGDDLEVGRIIREAVNRRLAEWRELEADDVSDAELEQAFRDVYAANALGSRLAIVPVKEITP